MKKFSFILLSSLSFLTSGCYGQDIPQSQVPSLVLNNFKKSFPKAYDVEWELKGEQYKVEFESGLSNDHTAYYSKTGKLLRHEEEISKNELPGKIIVTLKSDFNDYRLDDIKKTTSEGNVFYTVELDSTTQDWKVTFDKSGKLLNQIND